VIGIAREDAKTKGEREKERTQYRWEGVRTANKEGTFEAEGDRVGNA